MENKKQGGGLTDSFFFFLNPIVCRLQPTGSPAAAAASDLCLSLDDLWGLRGGQLTDALTAAVEALDAHGAALRKPFTEPSTLTYRSTSHSHKIHNTVVEQCARCNRAASRPCALCHDTAAPLFAHHFWAVAQCASCQALMHWACLRQAKATVGCPACGAAL